MLGLRKGLKSIVLAVVFIALASLASYFYSSDQARQIEIKDNQLLKKGKELISVVLGASGEIANSSAERNLGFGNKMVDTADDFIKNTDWQGIIDGTKTIKDSVPEDIAGYVANNDNAADSGNAIDDLKNIAAEATEITDSVAPIVNSENSTSGFFSKVVSKFKEEWERIKAEDAASSVSGGENIFGLEKDEEPAAAETNGSLE